MIAGIVPSPTEPGTEWLFAASLSEDARGDGLRSLETPVSVLDDALPLPPEPSLSVEEAEASARESLRASRRSTRSLH